MYSTQIFFICYKLSSLSPKIGKPEKSKFGRIDSWIIYRLRRTIFLKITIHFVNACVVWKLKDFKPQESTKYLFIKTLHENFCLCRVGLKYLEPLMWSVNFFNAFSHLLFFLSKRKQASRLGLWRRTRLRCN